MPPAICCCPGCELGTDNFDRADANPPSGRWYEISGDWAIDDQYLIDNDTPGILATTICHPPIYDDGSWIANFKLREVRSRSLFHIRAGHPQTSPYEVKYEPSGIDSPTAKITVTVIGPGGLEDSVEHPWPVDEITGDSADEVDVFACYQPGVTLRASIGSFGGQVPVAQICIEEDNGAPCYKVSGNDVGNFSWLEGAFDDWEYFTTIIDDLDCPACGCLCVKGLKPDDQYNPERKCFPDELMATFELIESDVDASECPLNDFEVVLSRFGNDNEEWISEDQTLCSNTFALKLNCENFDDGDQVFRALTLQLLNSTSDPTAAIVFAWEDPDFGNGESAAIRNPDVEESTCEPISLVYNRLKLACFFGPCSYPGTSGQIPFCCDQLCLTECPTIIYKVTITEV